MVEVETVKLLNPCYQNKEFEYITPGYKTYPNLENLEVVAVKFSGLVKAQF